MEQNINQNPTQPNMIDFPMQELRSPLTFIPQSFAPYTQPRYSFTSISPPNYEYPLLRRSVR